MRVRISAPVVIITTFVAITGYAMFGNSHLFTNKTDDENTVKASDVVAPKQVTKYIAPGDTNKLPVTDRYGDISTDNNGHNPFNYMPKNYKSTTVYDPDTKQYILTETVGDRFYRDPTYMSFEDYLKYIYGKDESDYWLKKRDAAQTLSKPSTVPKLVGTKDGYHFDIFDGTSVDIRPTGSVDMTFGGNYQNIQNPILTQQQRHQGGFDFDMNINMNVVANIGNALKMSTSYNTKAQFDFENQIKLGYAGKQDDIVKTIQAGNVNFPLTSQLINGPQNLFGLKTKMQFGRLTATGIISQKKSKTQTLTIQGGALTQQFSLQSSDFDENRNFFLGHYFRDHYEKALSTVPILNSGVAITKIQVWVTNSQGSTTNARDIVGFADMGEGSQKNIVSINPSTGLPTVNVNPSYGADQPPYAGAQFVALNSNDLYRTLRKDSNARSTDYVIQTLNTDGFVQGRDYEKTSARELSPSEFTYNAQLGYIAVNSYLNPSDVLAVAYQYTYKGKVYQVGDFAEDVTPNAAKPNVLWLKLLKGTSQQPHTPMWKLMMRNVYSLNAYSVNSDGFRLDVYYQDPGGGQRRYLPLNGMKGKPLLAIENLDTLDTQLDPIPDGVFDFISGITIIPASGKVIFPVLEPFGEHLDTVMAGTYNISKDVRSQYVFHQLYDSTKTVALQFPQFNRYLIKGQYKSSVSSDISLGGFNIPKGSVKVTAGGQQLAEDKDFTVDYNLGRLKIINQSILSSGLPIQVSFENNDLFGFNVKTLYGARFDYWVNDKLQLGSTILHLNQRPYTTKLVYGDDPISNTVAGLDLKYFTESPLITRLVNYLPNLKTKEKSTITTTGEIARFQPGHSAVIGKAGTIYIDDFEGAQTTYDLKFPFISWAMASTPQGVHTDYSQNAFPEATLINDLSYNYNRAHFNWYSIDPLFQRSDIQSTPAYIKSDTSSTTGCSNIFQREYYENELFPYKQLQPGLPTNLPTFDLYFNPKQRGAYNFATKVFDAHGNFITPNDKFGGCMRSLDYTDFEASNVEFIEFWIVDPFYYNKNAKGGQMYINLGDVSEDILRDSKQFFENALPNTSNNTASVIVDNSKWGRIANVKPIVPGVFDNDPATRAYQDVGYDGLSDDSEKIFHSSYLKDLAANLPGGTSNPLYKQALKDPSNDDFHYILGDDYDAAQVPALQRYRQWNGSEGNSPVSSTNLNYTPASTNVPESEDLNHDNTMVENEQYFQYRVDLTPGKLVVGQNFVTDKQTSKITLCNGKSEYVTFYQIKIPIEAYNAKVGNIQDFKSIRFMRMFLTGFQDSIYIRFAKLDLIRNQWRKYQYSLLQPGEYIPNDNSNNTYFNLGNVNLEENATKSPINYVIPPGVQREQLLSSTGTFLQNEQSMDLQVCNLQDGDMRAVYKTVNLDVRNYKRLRMFAHCEARDGQTLKDGDVTGIMRVGDDFTENYYEFEVPLHVTKSGTYQNDGDHDARIVWPDANEFNVLLDSLTSVKLERNIKHFPTTTVYTVHRKDGVLISIIGNPDLGLIKSIMLGVRNPKKGYLTGNADDGLPKCADVWFDELRLSDFNERGGWAGVGRADLKLANFGQITVSGQFHTPGYGQLESTLNERYKDYFYQYNAASTLQLGQLLGTRIKLNLPMYVGISETFSVPEYDPNELDVLFKTTLDAITNGHTRDSVKRASIDYVGIKSLNFTNVRIAPGKKRYVWSISNFNFSYSFTQTLKHSPIIDHDNTNQNRAEVGYAYGSKGLSIKPFKFVSTNKWLKLITDFNVNPVPTSIVFRTSVDKLFEETQLRGINPGDYFTPTYNEYFKNARIYGLKFDLTKSIAIDFNANANAIIDEPRGLINTPQKKDSLWKNINHLGRLTDYTHNASLSYTVPFNKLPLLDWIQSNFRYSTDYRWLSAPLVRNDEGTKLIFSTIGNTISNSQNIQLNGEFNLKNLYNKIPFFKKIQAYNRAKPPTKPMPKPGGIKPDSKLADPKKIVKEKPKEDIINPAVVFVSRLLLTLKKVSFTYTETHNTVVPGFLPRPNFMGQNSGMQAPGLNFLYGYQPDSNWLNNAARKGWMSKDSNMNYPLIQNSSRNYSGRATLEPIKDFNIDLNLNYTYTLNSTEFFKYNYATGSFQQLNPVQTGTYTISYILWRTTFAGRDASGFSNTYRTFEANRRTISKRLGDANPNSVSLGDSAGYRNGYNNYAQDVLIPSFFAAYTGGSINKAKLNTLSNTPLPNWRINYAGLSKIPFIHKIFTSITLTHSYSSSYSVSNFSSSLNYQGRNLGGQNIPSVRDSTSHNFIPYYTISQVVLTEQLQPLLGVDMVWKNNITTRLQYNKSRTISLSMLNYQLSETNIKNIVLGLGYKWKKAPIPTFLTKGRKRRLKNDITIKCDASLSDNETEVYRIDQNYHQITQGIQTITIAPLADYTVNKNVVLQLFFTKTYSLPHTSTSYPITSTRFGITAKFTLQ